MTSDKPDWTAAADALAFGRQAFGLAVRLVGDAALAEDLCQEAWLRLARMVPTPEGSLRSLVFKIVHRLAIDALRARGLRTHDPLDEAGAEPSDLGSPAEEACRREERELVQRCLEAMSPASRATVYLRDGLGLSYSEIAGATGRSEDVVRVTLHRARARARHLLRRLVAEGPS